jgi:hypothetical protein
VGGANIQIVYYFDHGYLKEEKSLLIQRRTLSYDMYYNLDSDFYAKPLANQVL